MFVEVFIGFFCVVVKYFDGRGIYINYFCGKVFCFGQVFKVEGEGMFYKCGEVKGDLYFVVKIEFFKDGWFESDDDYEVLKKFFFFLGFFIVVDEIDDVEFMDNVDIEEVCFFFFGLMKIEYC